MPAAAMQSQKDVDRLLKKVDESLRALATLRQRPEAVGGRAQRGKGAEEMRRLLEGLQRHHAELRRWTSQMRNVSKGKLEEARIRIESEMKRFHEFERVLKTDVTLTRAPVKECLINHDLSGDGPWGAGGANGKIAGAGEIGVSSETKVQADQLLSEELEHVDMVDEFICKICQVHIVGRGPKLARCSHLFCGDCIATWFASHPGNQTWAQRAKAVGIVPCPVCKEPLHEEDDLFPVCAEGRAESAMLWQMLSGLRIACANHPRCRPDGACTWTGEYGSFQKHFQSCRNAPLEEPPAVHEPIPAAPTKLEDAWDEGVREEEEEVAPRGEEKEKKEEGEVAARPAGEEEPPPVVAETWDEDLEDDGEQSHVAPLQHAQETALDESAPTEQVPDTLKDTPVAADVEEQSSGSLTHLIRSLMELKVKEQQISTTVETSGVTQKPGPAPQQTPAQPPAQPFAVAGPVAGVVKRVCCPFAATAPAQLTLKGGDLVEVLEQHESGWTRGRHMDAATAQLSEGWFPSWALNLQ